MGGEEPSRLQRTGGFELRDVQLNDIPAFFDHQLDPTAAHMAAFTSESPSDRAAFAERWTRILGDDAITKRTVLIDGDVAGHLASFERFGELEVTYWIARPHWGKGVATRALAEFLEQMATRPLFARAAKDNVASIRVLQKCGFTITGEDRAFAQARGQEIEELVLELRAGEVR